MVDLVQASGPRPLEPAAVAKLPVGATFATTIRTFRRSPWKLIGLVLLPFPIQFLTGVLQALVARPSQQAGAGMAVLVVLVILQYVVLLVIAGAFYAAGSQIIEQGRFSFGTALGVGIRRLLPLLGAVILFSLGVAVGFLLLVIPGIFLMLMWSVAMPACVIERLGPITSLSRSRALTKDNRWRILGVFLLVGFVPIAIIYAVAFGLIALKLRIIGIVVLALGGIVVGAVFGTFPAVMFHELRALKEGVGMGGVSRVFE